MCVGSVQLYGSVQIVFSGKEYLYMNLCILSAMSVCVCVSRLYELCIQKYIESEQVV